MHVHRNAGQRIIHLPSVRTGAQQGAPPRVALKSASGVKSPKLLPTRMTLTHAGRMTVAGVAATAAGCTASTRGEVYARVEFILPVTPPARDTTTGDRPPTPAAGTWHYTRPPLITRTPPTRHTAAGAQRHRHAAAPHNTRQREARAAHRDIAAPHRHLSRRHSHHGHQRGDTASSLQDPLDAPRGDAGSQRHCQGVCVDSGSLQQRRYCHACAVECDVAQCSQGGTRCPADHHAHARQISALPCKVGHLQREVHWRWSLRYA